MPFARHCRIEVTELSERGGLAVLQEAPNLLNHVFTLHAGALFTVAETASGACMLGLVGLRFQDLIPLARSAHISFRRPAKGSITAHATASMTRQKIYDSLDQAGRVDFMTTVDLHDDAGQAVARAEVSWHLRLR